MRNLKKQKGQSLLEVFLFTLTLILFIKVCFALSWTMISLIWIEHQLYQGLVCSAQQKNPTFCEKIIKQNIQNLNPLGIIKSLKIKNLKKIWQGEIQWQFYKKNFFITQSLYLPY